MMFALILDVCNHIGNLSLANRESSVAILPLKAMQFRKFRMNPF